VKRLLLAVIAVACLLAAGPARAQSGEALQQSPGIPPPGANDPSCHPSAQHPVPVILVHGTFDDMTRAWNLFSPALVKQGFCVYALDLVRRGMAPIDQSADKLAAFIDQVRSQTGAAKVSLIGHSQGGMLPRYVARYRGKLDVIDDIVGLAPSSHGTTNPLAGPVATAFDCPACAEQEAGSPFMQKLNAGDEAPAPIWYTVVSTRYDEVVTPYQSQALAGAQATNIVLQDKCPNDTTDHNAMTYDPIALEWALDALLQPRAASASFIPDCSGATFGTDPFGGTPSGSPGGRRQGAGGSTVRLLRHRARARHGRVRIGLRCIAPPGGSCVGRLRLRRAGRLVGSRAFSAREGQKKFVRVRLARQERRVLRRGHRIHVRARALVQQPGGGVRVASRRYAVR
jgi:pimeloyl-ACP methyl ester carboxylesterase